MSGDTYLARVEHVTADLCGASLLARYFDRLLVAQSMTEPLILLTVDSKLARYGDLVRVT